MYQRRQINPGKGKNSIKILSLIPCFWIHSVEMARYTISNTKCVEQISTSCQNKAAGLLCTPGIQDNICQAISLAMLSTDLKHTLAQAGWEFGHNSFSNIYFQVCLVPRYVEIVLHLVLSSRSLMQIFKNNTQKQAEVSLSGTTYKCIQRTTLNAHKNSSW